MERNTIGSRERMYIASMQLAGAFVARYYGVTETEQAAKAALQLADKIIEKSGFVVVDDEPTKYPYNG